MPCFPARDPDRFRAMNITNLSATDLRRAADIAERIEGLNAELSRLLSGASGVAGSRTVGVGSRRQMARSKTQPSEARFGYFHF